MAAKAGTPLTSHIFTGPRLLSPLPSPPFVTCRAWAVADGETGQTLLSSAAEAPCQIASITKVATALVVLRLAAREPGLLSEQVLISPEASSIGGTTAGLRAGEVYTVLDLLYGLMLPSGNDAASALAEYVGGAFSLPSAASAGSGRGGAGGSAHRLVDHPHTRFVAEMNRECARLGLASTRFGNPHGLGDVRGQSCAADVCRLAACALRDFPLLAEIGRCRSYTCIAGAVPGRLMRTGKWSASGGVAPRSYPCAVTWENTNALLGATVSARLDATASLPVLVPAPPPPATLAESRSCAAEAVATGPGSAAAAAAAWTHDSLAGAGAGGRPPARGAAPVTRTMSDRSAGAASSSSGKSSSSGATVTMTDASGRAIDSTGNSSRSVASSASSASATSGGSALSRLSLLPASAPLRIGRGLAGAGALLLAAGAASPSYGSLSPPADASPSLGAAATPPSSMQAAGVFAAPLSLDSCDDSPTGRGPHSWAPAPPGLGPDAAALAAAVPRRPSTCSSAGGRRSRRGSAADSVDSSGGSGSGSGGGGGRRGSNGSGSRKRSGGGGRRRRSSTSRPSSPLRKLVATPKLEGLSGGDGDGGDGAYARTSFDEGSAAAQCGTPDRGSFALSSPDFGAGGGKHAASFAAAGAGTGAAFCSTSFGGASSGGNSGGGARALAVSSAAAVLYGTGNADLATRGYVDSASDGNGIAGIAARPGAGRLGISALDALTSLSGPPGQAKPHVTRPAPVASAVPAATSASASAAAPATTVATRPLIVSREVSYVIEGLKTGITPVAGGCLCTSMRLESFEHALSPSPIALGGAAAPGGGSGSPAAGFGFGFGYGFAGGASDKAGAGRDMGTSMLSNLAMLGALPRGASAGSVSGNGGAALFAAAGSSPHPVVQALARTHLTSTDPAAMAAAAASVVAGALSNGPAMATGAAGGRSLASGKAAAGARLPASVPPPAPPPFRHILITVLGSACKASRFRDTEAVAAYAARVLHSSHLVEACDALRSATAVLK